MIVHACVCVMTIFISSLCSRLCECACMHMCYKLERALSHFALFNPFSVCDEIKYD